MPESSSTRSRVLQTEEDAAAAESRRSASAAGKGSGAERRLGVVGVVCVGSTAREQVTAVLRDYRRIVLFKTGVPCRRRGQSMFCVAIETTTNELGAFTGKLGMLDGVKVKSFLL